MLFNRLKYNEVVWIGTRVPIFLKAVFDLSFGIREGLLGLRSLHNFAGKGNITISFDLPRTTTSSVFKKFMGKDEFLQATQVLAPRFRLFGTFIPNNANAGGSAMCIHKDLLLDEAMVTHVVTCQGRDHIVSVRS